MIRCIARQPILDRLERVYGFELQPRRGEEEIWRSPDVAGTEEGAPAAAPPFDWISEFTEGTRAFIKCTPQAMASGQVALLPRDQVVLETPVPSTPDEGFVKTCRTLKAAGYAIALENYQSTWEVPLTDIADMVKVDVTAFPDRIQWLLIRKYRPNGIVFIADKVDKRSQFQAAGQQGFSYFQGQFYSRAEPFSTSELTPTKLVYLLVLRAVTRPEINMQEVADTIKHDLALSYRLLRFLNSARFAFHSKIKSVRHALLLLGQNEIRKWIGLVSLAALGEGGPPLPVNMALIRAAFCEALAPLVGATKRESDYFFLGLLSSIDILMRRPMRVILAELPMASDVSDALMGEQNSLRDVLQAVTSYEQGKWEECFQLGEKLGLKEENFPGLFLRALRWSRELTQIKQAEPADVRC